MKKANEKIALSRECIKNNRYHFNEMSLRSQKIFFLPLTRIFWGIKDTPYSNPIPVSLSKEEIKNALGIKADDKHFGSEFKKYYREMVLEGLGFDKRNDEKMYECAYRNFPIKLIRFEGNNVIFTVDPISDFTQLGRKNTYVNPFVAIDINDILNNSTANALRLSLAMMVMVTQSTDNKPFEFSATTKQLKDIFGLGRLDYCTISGEHKEFLKEYYPYHELYIKYGGFDLEHVDTKRIYQLRTKYGFSSNEEMENCFVNNMSDIHFERYPF